MNPGTCNAITNVEGVIVDNKTILEKDIYSGFPVILPNNGNLALAHFPAGFYSFNGTGEFTGSHWNKTNLPNQLNYGSRLIGRWMKDNGDDTVEIFDIWEYNSYEDYVQIESKVRSDQAHLKRIHDWYEKNGGREHVLTEYILEMRNEALESTVMGDE